MQEKLEKIKFSDGKTLRYLINIIHYMAYYSYRGEHDDLFGRIGKKWTV